jgi:histidyl-tRNA synthetase
MAAQKPSIPKGTRDFSPVEMVKRNYIFDTIKGVFKKYGFQPIETPAMENIETLTGKYGDEGDQLLFKILNSRPQDAKEQKKAQMLDIFKQTLEKSTNSAVITERALRYDLTVPFARFVVQHQNEISFPFKRYQIQPVWRADRPQKGRYREFYQCDVDVVGSNSLLNELELLQIVDQVFNLLDVNVLIKLNNRKILSGIAEIIGQSDKIIDITVAIDKLDKIGLENVNKELLEKDIPQDAVEKIQPIILLSGSNSEKLEKLKAVLATSEIGLKGIEELEKVFNYLESININTEIELDLTLARGLNYYTGAIIEVKAKDVAIGSICGGGRYDDLTGIFGLPNVSGVGISFGADRIYDVLNQQDKFPKQNLDITQVLFVNFGEQEEKFCLPILAKLREQGLNAEIFPESAKMKKQMTYANKREIPFVVIIGANEMAENKAMVKNMLTGEQNEVAIDKLYNFF